MRALVVIVIMAAASAACAVVAGIDPVTYRSVESESGSPASGDAATGTLSDGGGVLPLGCDPDSGFVRSVPPAGKNGDWNCDGVVTMEFPVGEPCGSAGLADCSKVQGFYDSPGCGEAGLFETCIAAGSRCVSQPTGEQRAQGCR